MRNRESTSERNRAAGVNPRYQRRPVESERVGEELSVEFAQHQEHMRAASRSGMCWSRGRVIDNVEEDLAVVSEEG